MVSRPVQNVKKILTSFQKNMQEGAGRHNLAHARPFATGGNKRHLFKLKNRKIERLYCIRFFSKVRFLI